MKINHLNLTVTDVPAATAYLETYFNLTCSEMMGKGFSMMTDDDGFLLNLMKAKEVNYPETFHMGFQQTTREQVDAVNKHLKEDGYEVEQPDVVHGSYTFYHKAPGGFTIEVFCLLENVDPTKGARPSFGK